ncbi:MAG: hypothetical protein U0795_03695 [Pirellulales bacterium]
MKADRRHELQHNELSDLVGDTLHGVVPYWRVIAGVLALVVAAGVAFSLLSRRTQMQESASWTEYLSALSKDDVELLRDVAERHPGTPMSMWAFLRVGDASLAEGNRLMFEDRAEAAKKLKEAQESFELVAGKAQDSILRQQATFGLAQTLEVLNKLPEAEAKYESITKLWPDSTMAELAKQRLEAVRQPQTKEFYTWFASQTPKPPAAGAAAGGAGDFNYLPSNPNMTVPGRTPPPSTPQAPSGAPATSAPPADVNDLDLAPAQTEKPASEAPATEAPATEAPAAAPPASETPAAEKPAAEAPAAEKPAAEVPAAEAPAGGASEPGASGAGSAGTAGGEPTGEANPPSAAGQEPAQPAGGN